MLFLFILNYNLCYIYSVLTLVDRARLLEGENRFYHHVRENECPYIISYIHQRQTGAGAEQRMVRY